jgi:hypothetical protein
MYQLSIKNPCLLLFLLLSNISCNEISKKTEKILSEEIKKDLINNQICKGVNVVDIIFDNNPEDNKGLTKYKLKGTIALIPTTLNDRCIVKREISIPVDIEKNSWEFTINEETQESMRYRMIKLLQEGSFSSEYSSEKQLSGIEFESESSGHYYTKEGEKYKFSFHLSKIQHINDFPPISNGVSCNIIDDCLDLNKQSYRAQINMSNSRFDLNGYIELFGPDNNLSIKGEIVSSESSKSEELELSLTRAPKDKIKNSSSDNLKKRLSESYLNDEEN